MVKFNPPFGPLIGLEDLEKAAEGVILVAHPLIDVVKGRVTVIQTVIVNMDTYVERTTVLINQVNLGIGQMIAAQDPVSVSWALSYAYTDIQLQ